MYISQTKKAVIESARELQSGVGYFECAAVVRLCVRKYTWINPESVGRINRKLAELGYFVRVSGGIFRFK